MTEGAEVQSFTIEHSLGTTVTVNGETHSPTWIKPGVGTSFTFSGVPTKEQIRAASKYMVSEVLDPLIADIVENVAESLRKGGAPPNF